MRRLIIALLLTFTVISTQAQEEIRLAVWQDARLAVSKDKTETLSPFTLDVLAKLKLTGKQTDAGYLVISPMFEYADLDGIYKRYAVDLGFTFNQSLLWGLEVTPSINYGIQDRWGKAFLVFGADLEVSIEITDGLRVSALGQLVERKDLDWAYGGNKHYQASGFIGLQYRIFNTKLSR